MLLRRVARPLLASVFIADGWRAVRRPEAEIEHLPQARTALASVADRVPLPVSPDLLVRAGGAAKIVAGSLLGLGIAPRAAATVLTVLHLPTALAAHPFWEIKGEERREHMLGLLRDAAILGGLLLAAADTAGKPSLAWRIDTARATTSKQVATSAKHAKRTAKVAKVAAKQTLARVPDKAKLALAEVTDH